MQPILKYFYSPPWTKFTQKEKLQTGWLATPVQDIGRVQFLVGHGTLRNHGPRNSRGAKDPSPQTSRTLLCLRATMNIRFRSYLFYDGGHEFLAVWRPPNFLNC